MDWLNVSNKLEAVSEGDRPCMSAANCLIQYLHQVVHKSYGAVKASEEEAMKRAFEKVGGALHWNQMLDGIF